MSGEQGSLLRQITFKSSRKLLNIAVAPLLTVLMQVYPAYNILGIRTDRYDAFAQIARDRFLWLGNGTTRTAL